MENHELIERRCINALRFLAVDAVEQANSGHPGLPLGAASTAHALWSRVLRHDPHDPQWPDRDRFVLSAGHGSALLYALLHLYGYDVPLSDVKAFRQWGSRAPGHPERTVTPGVEVTTGPLGQGVANAVGLAIAERHLAATFNRPGHEIVSHRTFVLAGDGDFMEGISYEACALAGHLRLDRLVVLYDSNDICLAGSTTLSTSEDAAARFAAAGWNVQSVPDGNDLAAIARALRSATEVDDRPSLIIVKTVIGYGAPTKQNTFGAHGAPLGPEEVAATKRALGWPESPAFLVPDDVRQRFADLAGRGVAAHGEWNRRFDRYRRAFPDLATEFERRRSGRLPEDWDVDLPTFPADPKGIPTRKASETVLQAIAAAVPELLGGSADLNPSTLTWIRGGGDFESPDLQPGGTQGAVGAVWGYGGRNLHFGVREHAMGAISNGLAAHGGVLPFASTFLVFSDYLRPAIRVAALADYRTIFAFTHDSIAVGEDGPTHQPVEHIMSLRLIPNLVVLRPADANETVEAWRLAVERVSGPTALVLSRQALPTLDRAQLAPASGVRRGAYVLWDTAPSPELILIASGSEVALILDAARRLTSEGIAVRIVSMPSWELFEQQPETYRTSVLPPTVSARVAVEAGRTLGWDRYVGARGHVIGIDRFGASAPGPEVAARLGLTAETIVRRAHDMLKR
jgi:transketolase